MTNTPQPTPDELLQKGIRAARRGHKEPARRLLSQVIQVDPNQEEAWLWLARVVDNPNQRAECLKQVLRLNPGNQWAAGELAQIQSPVAVVPPPTPEVTPATGKASSPPSPQPAADLSVEALNCPQCKGVLDLKSGSEAKTLVCSYCGSVLDLTGEQAAIIGQTNRRIKPTQPINLGMEGTFEGELHQVIGWVRYEGWDDEDRWRWDEWLLASAGGKFRWLSYDPEEGFILQQKIQPAGPFDPITATSIPTPTGSAQVAERSPAKLLALEGELTWRAAVGDQITYLEARQANLRYSVEYTAQELELLEGRTLTETEVWTAFGREDLLKQIAEQGRWKSAYKVLALACAFLTGLSCLVILFTIVTGETIFNQQVQLVKGEAVAKEVGPVEITQPARIHQISLQAGTLPSNSWAEVEVSISGEAEKEIFLFAEEFWDEMGRDSDGPWHESDLSGEYVFKPDQAGKYYLELSMDEATVPSLPVTVTVKQGVWLSRYLIIYTVICLVLCLIFAFLGLARQLTR